MEVEYFENPSVSDIDFITQKINAETLQYGEASPFAFFIKDNKKNILAGANGFIIYGTIYIDQLWVDAKYRKQGLAKKLMDKVHYLGLEKECKIATIQTMDFQNAKEFYKKLGYQEDFKREGYVKGSSCIFMKKVL